MTSHTHILARLIFGVSLTTGLIMSTGCGSSTPKSPPTPAEDAPLAVNMQSMSILVKRLMPVLVDKQSFEAQSQDSRIKRDISQLADIAKNVSHSDYKKLADPSFGFLSEGFREEIGRANEAFSQGKKDFARYSLLNMTSYCIECHTRTASGPAFESPEFDQTLTRLQPLEKGEYLLAIRRFDSALEEFLKVLDGKDKRPFNFYEYDRAIRYALAITVKFQRDVNKTERVINQVMAEEKVPYFLRQAAIEWKKSLKNWRSEKSPKSPSVKTRLTHAQRLIRTGLAAQNGQADRSGDIDLLRGLSELHQLLTMDLKPDEKGESLFLTGQAYESVRDMSLWAMHENYYESCIQKVPHGRWAKRCYKALEESIFLGYTGTAGTDIPTEVSEKLSGFKKLAE